MSKTSVAFVVAIFLLTGCGKREAPPRQAGGRGSATVVDSSQPAGGAAALPASQAAMVPPGVAPDDPPEDPAHASSAYKAAQVFLAIVDVPEGVRSEVARFHLDVQEWRRGRSLAPASENQNAHQEGR